VVIDERCFARYGLLRSRAATRRTARAQAAARVVSVRRPGLVHRDQFQVALWRLQHAREVVAGMPDEHEARAAFIKDGAAWLWAEHREHVRRLPAETQLALVDDAYTSDKRVASAMLAALFPPGARGPVVGL
jgi:hypothetical protein